MEQHEWRVEQQPANSLGFRIESGCVSNPKQMYFATKETAWSVSLSHVCEMEPDKSLFLSFYLQQSLRIVISISVHLLPCATQLPVGWRVFARRIYSDLMERELCFAGVTIR